ncbi:MAG: hypothetical protein ABR907_05310 [Terracidiphilus sp.]|jgi:hypothetical protein
MTLLQADFVYEGPIGEREAACIAEIRNIYGIWALKLDEKNRTVIVDYDASRLNGNDIAFMLRNAGISLTNPIHRAAWTGARSGIQTA